MTSLTDTGTTNDDQPMTEQQRETIRQLCHEADIPDKSGEILSKPGADSIIAELRQKAAERDKA